VLSDPVKRQTYDRHGHAGLRGSGMHDFSHMGFGDIFSMFADIFGDRGFGGGRPGVERGLDLETEVELTLMQVATGVDHTLEFERIDYCDTCGGTGARSGSKPQGCSDCGGYGKVQQQVQSFFGMSVRVIDCPACRGRGQIIKDRCPACRGSGRARKKRILSVHIPPGVHEGQVVRARGEGEPSPGGTSRGDLHVYVRIKPHPLLSRRGDDILCQVPVSFAQAAMGARVPVPTLSGMEEVEVPAGTQNGDVVRLKDRGLPDTRTGRRGSQYVQVVVEVPRKLSRKQRELLEAFAAEEEKPDSPSERKNFLQKLMDYFSAEKK